LTEIEEAVAEPEPALHEGGPGVPTDHAVDLEAAIVLERPDRDVGRGAEDSGLVRSGAVSQRAQPPLEVADGFAACARAEDQRVGHDAAERTRGRCPPVRRRTRRGPGGAAPCPWRPRAA